LPVFPNKFISSTIQQGVCLQGAICNFHLNQLICPPRSKLWHNVGITENTNTKAKLMKTSTNTSVLLKAIDLELKTLLQQDIERFKIINENKRALVKKAA
jgi:hypothetical protein